MKLSITVFTATSAKNDTNNQERFQPISATI